LKLREVTFFNFNESGKARIIGHHVTHYFGRFGSRIRLGALRAEPVAFHVLQPMHEQTFLPSIGISGYRGSRPGAHPRECVTRVALSAER